MPTKYRLNQVAQLQNRNIFIDANILIYLFWPSGTYYLEEKYAKVFKALLIQRNPLFVDFFVISEIINRVLRIEHIKLQPAAKFKDFRNSVEGQDALSDIYLIVKNDILPALNIVGKVFTKEEIENFLIVDELDFVDKSTVSVCKENSFLLLTNDKDFKNVDLDILTGNPTILN